MGSNQDAELAMLHEAASCTAERWELLAECQDELHSLTLYVQGPDLEQSAKAALQA